MSMSKCWRAISAARDSKHLQLVENLMREDLNDAEIYLACQELMALNPDWLKKDLAAALHFDASMVDADFCGR